MYYGQEHNSTTIHETRVSELIQVTKRLRLHVTIVLPRAQSRSSHQLQLTLRVGRLQSKSEATPTVALAAAPGHCRNLKFTQMFLSLTPELPNVQSGWACTLRKLDQGSACIAHICETAYHLFLTWRSCTRQVRKSLHIYATPLKCTGTTWFWASSNS